MFSIIKPLTVFAISLATSFVAYHRAYAYLNAQMNLDGYQQVLSFVNISNTQLAAAIAGIIAFLIMRSLARFVIGKIMPL